MEQILAIRQEVLVTYFDHKNGKLKEFLERMENIGFEALKKGWPKFKQFKHLQENGVLDQEILCVVGNLNLKVGYLREELRNDPAVVKKLDYARQLFRQFQIAHSKHSTNTTQNT